MRFCTLCSHQLRQQIDELLLQNTSFRNISERFNLSLGAISRHRSHCLRAALQSRQTENAETVLSRVERLQQRTEAILTASERDDDRAIALASIREARRNYELLGRLNGELEQKSAAARNMGGEGLSIEVIFQLPDARPGKIDNSVGSAIIDVADNSPHAIARTKVH